MTLLDTNVISEVMKPQPDTGVINWMNATATNSLFVSTITIAEIRYGIELLPDGRRRVDLEGRFEHFLSLGFSQRIVSFDERAASVYGAVMATRRRLGAPLASLDGFTIRSPSIPRPSRRSDAPTPAASPPPSAS